MNFVELRDAVSRLDIGYRREIIIELKGGKIIDRYCHSIDGKALRVYTDSNLDETEKYKPKEIARLEAK